MQPEAHRPRPERRRRPERAQGRASPPAKSAKTTAAKGAPCPPAPQVQDDVYRTAFAASSTPLLMLAPDPPRFSILDVNKAYLRATRRKREDLIGRPLFEAAPENPVEAGADGLAKLRTSLERALSSRRPDHMAVQKYDVAGPTGEFEERWWDAVNTPVLDAAGEVVALVHNATDVTARRRAEQQLRESEARYRTLFQSIDAGFFLIRLELDDAGRAVDYRFLEANAGLERLSGVTNPVGRRVRELIPDLEPFWLDAFGKVAATGEPVQFRYRGRGSDRWYDVRAYRAEGLGENCVAALLADITDQQRNEQRLQQLNHALEHRVDEAQADRQLFADIVEDSDTMMEVVDRDCRWLALNRAAIDAYDRLFGCRPRLGQSALAPYAPWPDQEEVARELWSRALSGESLAYTGEFGDPRHGRRIYDTRLRPLRGRDGRLLGAVQITGDVTERILAEQKLAAAEEALRQTQKLETIGELTGGVAHDFNNLLTPIMGALDLLQRCGFGAEREQRLLKAAAQSAERARSLVHRLLAFARRQPLKPSPVDTIGVVHSMAELIASTLGPQIELALDLPAALPPARADQNQLEMALLNLCVNARDAMGCGGRLSIQLRSERVAPGARPDVPPGTFICVSVADTGVGMDEATLARAIEPFFSTKGVGHGTGLGLSMAHGLATQLGGALTISSELGVGTEVRLWLPVSAEPAEPLDRQPHRPSPAGALGVALLVDDEAAVRASTAEMLAELGYEVEQAATAEAALRRVHERGGLDLLVTDHLMPGMTGADLIAAARKLRPGLPALLISGYLDVDKLPPELPRLVKPFRSADLAESLASI